MLRIRKWKSCIFHVKHSKLPSSLGATELSFSLSRLLWLHTVLSWPQKTEFPVSGAVKTEQLQQPSGAFYDQVIPGMRRYIFYYFYPYHWWWCHFRSTNNIRKWWALLMEFEEIFQIKGQPWDEFLNLKIKPNLIVPNCFLLQTIVIEIFFFSKSAHNHFSDSDVLE